MASEGIIDLNNDEIQKLLTLASKITANPCLETDLFCFQAKEHSRNIPERLKDLLVQFSKKGSKTGFLLIRTIPFDNNSIPPTPNLVDPINKIGENTILARIQSLFISFIANLISYEAESNGRLFQDIFPVKGMEKQQTSVGSSTELEIHTEQAFSKLKPDILCLACIRSNPEAKTHILPVSSIIQNMDSHEQQLLRLPLWKTGVDLSFKLNNIEFIHGDIRGPMPILSGQLDDPILTFDQDLMFGIKNEFNTFIDKIVDIYYQKRISHVLLPGEIVLIDNLRAVHGRSPFTTKYDGNDRFIIRCFGIYNFESTRMARLNNNNRMISAIFS
jgi:L-asparagine oxygenase